MSERTRRRAPSRVRTTACRSAYRVVGRSAGRLFLLLALLAVGLGAAGVAQAAGPTVWVIPSMQRVRPDDAAGTATSISLAAAKGETESFQIVVKAPSANGLTNVNVTTPSLGGTQLTLYREHYIYLASGSADWATNVNKPEKPGWFPDALVPFTNPSTGAPLTGGSIVGAPFPVSAAKNQPVWVDILVPRTASAGTSTGTFTVTSDQGSASVSVTLRIWNFTLPVKPAEESCFMYWPTSSSGEGRGVLQPDAELLRNRINPVSTSASYERQFIDTLGMQSVSLPFWSSANQSTGTMNPAPSVSSIQTAMAQHQQDLDFYCYSADEVSNPLLYPGIKSWGRNLHAAGADQLITMSPVPELFDDGSGTGRSAVDEWVVLPKMYDADVPNILTAQGKGDKVWSYNCTQQDNYSPKWLLDYAPLNYRIQPGFINQSLGLVGLLYWRVDWWTVDPWTGSYPWPYLPGEGLLVYPGAPVGLTGQVVPSMRIKYLRDGIDDYDYIDLLKKTGYGDWALSIARGVGPDWRNWTRDPNVLEAARIQLGNKLDSLGGGSHTVSVTASANPTSVASGGSTTLSASATDSSGHTISSWAWSDGGAGGTFSSSTAQNPTYTAPTNSSGADETVTLTCTATCSGAVSGVGTASLTVQFATTFTFSDVPADFWAAPQIYACVVAKLVKGYDDGTYRPTWSVTRDQMGVYLARALAGGDDKVPAGPATPTFTDVATDFWAYKYIEYAVARGVVTGFKEPDGTHTYRPATVVDRRGMAVFVARSIVSPLGEAGLTSYTPPTTATFSDVAVDSWGYKHIEYLAGQGVVKGYDDGTYRPDKTVTRDQMAVYVARAFKLPL